VTWPINHEEENNEPGIKIPISTVYRWFLYDVAGADAPTFNEVFQLTPVSPEGDEKEQDDSDNRLEAIEDLLSFAHMYADITSEYAFEVHRKQMLKMPEVTEELLESSKDSLTSFYSNMIFAGIVSVLSASTALKLITLNNTYPEIREGEL
jgi:hypothetical protein